MGKNTTFLIVWILAVPTASPKALVNRFGSLEGSGARGADQDYFYCVLIDEVAEQASLFYCGLLRR